MKKIPFHIRLKTRLISLLCTAFISACDNSEPAKDAVSTIAETNLSNSPVIEPTSTPKIEIENKSYLFDVTTHTVEELEALLVRAEEVSQAHPADFEDLEIVMVIHGPDIDLFKKDNYENNQQLIDLAARLDAYDVIDMKVCQRTMEMRGVEREEIPSFIESVPFAPTEIKERLNNGYINL